MRSRYGLCMSALGALLLGASVFIPWYAAPRGPTGLAGAVRDVAVGRLSQLDAWHGLPELTAVLLVLAALALLDVLLPLVNVRTEIAGGAGRALVLVGAVAAACTLYRMIDPPVLHGLFAPSLREGAWLALIGAGAVMLGGIWPHYAFGQPPGRLAAGTLSWK